jgi:hypothetical protein
MYSPETLEIQLSNPDQAGWEGRATVCFSQASYLSLRHQCVPQCHMGQPLLWQCLDNNASLSWRYKTSRTILFFTEQVKFAVSFIHKKR